MESYERIPKNILDSTIWLEDEATRCVWLTMLLMKNPDGVVEASVPGLAKRANVSRELTDRALAVLGSPDPDSRSPTNEGRRIVRVDGGWRLVNHEIIKRRLGAAGNAERCERYRNKLRVEHVEQHDPHDIDQDQDQDQEKGRYDPSITGSQQQPPLQQPLQQPRAIPCPNCQEPLTLYKNKSTNNHFYSHGRMGGNLGCRTTVDYETYLEAERIKAERKDERPLMAPYPPEFPPE